MSNSALHAAPREHLRVVRIRNRQFAACGFVDNHPVIAYHATIGVKHPPKGSLLEQCAAKAAGIDEFDATGRIGLLHIAFPLKMMLQPDGHLTSCDILHTAESLFEVQFGNVDLCGQGLCGLNIAKMAGACGPGYCDGRPTRWYYNEFFNSGKPPAGTAPAALSGGLSGVPQGATGYFQLDLKNGRYVLIPTSEETRGHGSHSIPKLWKQYLVELLTAPN